MNNPPDYTNREIDTIINGLSVRLDDRLTEQDKTLARIETQTIKTNGSVASIQKWRERSMGGVIVAGILIIPILGWALTQLVGIDTKIQNDIRHSDITTSK